MSLRRRIFGKKTAAALVAAVLLFAFDLTRAPGRQWTGKALVLAIDAYQATLSPAMGTMGVRCRFTPSCSRYTEAAIRHRGAVHGVALGARRIARCGPWTPLGTVDPPPDPLPGEPSLEADSRETTPSETMTAAGEPAAVEGDRSLVEAVGVEPTSE